MYKKRPSLVRANAKPSRDCKKTNRKHGKLETNNSVSIYNRQDMHYLRIIMTGMTITNCNINDANIAYQDHR